MKALMPWPNLAVSRAVITGNYEMGLSRTRRGIVSLSLQPSYVRTAGEVRAKIAVRGASRPDVLARLDHNLQKPLTAFIQAQAMHLDPAYSIACSEVQVESTGRS